MKEFFCFLFVLAFGVALLLGANRIEREEEKVVRLEQECDSLRVVNDSLMIIIDNQKISK